MAKRPRCVGGKKTQTTLQHCLLEPLGRFPPFLGVISLDLNFEFGPLLEFRVSLKSEKPFHVLSEWLQYVFFQCVEWRWLWGPVLSVGWYVTVDLGFPIRYISYDNLTILPDVTIDLRQSSYLEKHLAKVYLQNHKVVWDSVRELAYGIPRRKLSTPVSHYLN